MYSGLDVARGTVPVSAPMAGRRRDDDEYMEGVGARIERELAAREWTIEDLASKSGVKYATLYTYVRGDRTPDIVKALKIATALGIPAEDLFGEGQKVDGEDKPAKKARIKRG